jgi:hypothetical protein
LDAAEFIYFNSEALFDHCIRTDLYYGKFIKYPALIRDLARLFESDGQVFRTLILRCDSIDAVRRLFDLGRLHLKRTNFAFAFGQISKILLKNPVDRILSVKWALLFWQSEDPEHFRSNCPDLWKQALNRIIYI